MRNGKEIPLIRISIASVSSGRLLIPPGTRAERRKDSDSLDIKKSKMKKKKGVNFQLDKKINQVCSM